MRVRLSNGARLVWLLLDPVIGRSVAELAHDLDYTEREVRRRVDELLRAKLASKSTGLAPGQGYSSKTTVTRLGAKR